MAQNTKSETNDQTNVLATLAGLDTHVLIDRDTGDVMRSPAIGENGGENNLDVLLGRKAAYAAAAEWGRENVEAVPVTVAPKQRFPDSPKGVQPGVGWAVWSELYAQDEERLSDGYLRVKTPYTQGDCEVEAIAVFMTRSEALAAAGHEDLSDAQIVQLPFIMRYTQFGSASEGRS